MVSGTYNYNTIIIDTGRNIFVIRGWRGILMARLRVYSDIEAFTGIGRGVYSHPGWMGGNATQRLRNARGTSGLGNRSTQAKKQKRGDGRWPFGESELRKAARPEVRDVRSTWSQFHLTEAHTLAICLHFVSRVKDLFFTSSDNKGECLSRQNTF